MLGNHCLHRKGTIQGTCSGFHISFTTNKVKGCGGEKSVMKTWEKKKVLWKKSVMKSWGRTESAVEPQMKLTGSRQIKLLKEVHVCARSWTEILTQIVLDAEAVQEFTGNWTNSWKQAQTCCLWWRATWDISCERLREWSRKCIL